MKILFVTTVSNTVNAFLIPHIRFLIEHGNEVDVAFNIDGEVSPEIPMLGCTVYQVSFQRDPFNSDNFLAYKKVKGIVSSGGYELIHVHTPVAAFITRLACRKMDHVKMLYTAHGFHFFKGAPRKNWLLYHTIERIASKWTDCLITMNEEDFESAKKFKLRKGNSVYKVNGVGVDLGKFSPQTSEEKIRLRKEYGYSVQDFILIYVGELSFRKHQDLLINAISKLKDRIQNLKLLLVGSGQLQKEYRELAERLNVEGNIEFLGYREDVHKLMMISDVAVSTSRQEGLPVNVMEAMATGLPLVVTNCRGNRDLVSNGINGYVIELEDAEACAYAIDRLYQSSTLGTEFSGKSRESIQLYSLDSVIEEMKEIYCAYG